MASNASMRLQLLSVHRLSVCLPAYALCKCPEMQVAGRTNDAAGDGTTTATVLAREMIRFGLQVGQAMTEACSWPLCGC